VKANATSEGAPITSYEFCISTNSDMSGSTCQTVPASDADNYTFTGLTGNTIYYVQYKATNVAGTTTSSSVQQRTPAHAPTATVVTPLASTKPAGFTVEVIDIDPKERTDSTTVQVCYRMKGAGNCPEKESTEYTMCSDPVSVTGTTATITKTNLVDSTEYCVIVKVSNGDSTTVYGPYSVITAADVTLALTRTGGGIVRLCGASSVAVTYTATPSDNGTYAYTWSLGSSTTNTNVVTYSMPDVYEVTVTATHTTEGYTLTATNSVTISATGSVATLLVCEDNNLGQAVIKSTNCTSFSWKNSADVEVGTAKMLALSNTVPVGTYTVTGVNPYGCSITESVVLDTIVPRSCTAASMGSHAAQTGNMYRNNGFNGANHGLETVNGNGEITSVTDYDGNEYRVVQIGNQCWMAENLRCTHSPKTGSYIVGTPFNTQGSKVASWGTGTVSLNNTSVVLDSAVCMDHRFGLYYNWCAVVDSATSQGYVEVGTPDHYNTLINSIILSGIHQGVCPIGWHVPSDEDFNAMEAAVLGSSWQSGYATQAGFRGNHGGKLAVGCDWNITGTELERPGNYEYDQRNSTGFNGVPAGMINSSAMSDVGSLLSLWTISRYSSNTVSRRYLNSRYAGVARSGADKSWMFSVRCVRD
jgi:uncharacterized protein (TIGR02145 family)